MSILFDGAGRVGGFIAYLTGDCDVTLPTIRVDSTFGAIFGSDNDGTFLQPRSNEMRFRFNNANTTIDFLAQTAPFTLSDGRITRVGDQLTITLMGETKTITSTGIIDIRNWGSYNSGSSILQGEISGVGTIIGDSSGQDITHDFDGGSPGDTILTNTSHDSEHGTLINFTTGGYQTSGPVSDTVAAAGSDQAGIVAGSTVTLDSSDSTDVASRVWSETTASGVTLSDTAAIMPTFSAPSEVAAQEVIFRVTTTGSNSSTDFDDVSIFVLETGAVAPDPTITLTSVYGYYTRKADINFEAIFPVAGVITDLPTGAVAEYQLDGTGNWNPISTDLNGVFSTDVIITKQQNLVVRVSTHTDVTVAASYLTAGNTWLAWWQSNESGRGSSTQNSVRNELGTDDIRPTMFRDGTWQRLADPTSEDSTGGSTWVRIAVEFAKLGIPIGVINVAVGGTSIERWLPSGGDLWDTRIVAEVTEADCGGITYTASLGGESNVGTDGTVLRGWLAEMISQLHTDYGSTHYLTDIPRTYTNGSADTLRAEFDYIIENSPYCKFGGDLEVIDLSTSGDGTHLNSGAQVNDAAMLRFAAFTASDAIPLTANAGPDQQNIISGGRITLNGSNTLDPDNVIVSQLWEQPGGTTASIDEASALISSATLPTVSANETMTFKLTITDVNGSSYSDTVSYGVLASLESLKRIDSYTIKFKDNKQKVIKGYDNEVFIDFTFTNDFSLSEFTVLEIKIGNETFSTIDDPQKAYLIENRLVLNIGEETQLDVNKYKPLIIGRNTYYNSGHVFTSPVNPVLVGDLYVIELA